MRVAGIGCRRGVSAAEVEAVIAIAVAHLAVNRRRLDVLATLDAKVGEPGLVGAAYTLGLKIVPCAAGDLAAVASRCVTRSDRVQAAIGLPSVAEAAALAAAGAGSRLTVPRVSTGMATCAIAESWDVTQ